MKKLISLVIACAFLISIGCSSSTSPSKSTTPAAPPKGDTDKKNPP